MSTLLIRHGTLVSDLHTWRADIPIEDERIRDIAPAVPPASAGQVIDATGMLILPFRNRNPRGRVRRHHGHRRFRTWTCPPAAPHRAFFMAYPNVLMVDDATIFRASRKPRRTARSSACMRKTEAPSM
jgi:hypothetical protein